MQLRQSQTAAPPPPHSPPPPSKDGGYTISVANREGVIIGTLTLSGSTSIAAAFEKFGPMVKLNAPLKQGEDLLVSFDPKLFRNGAVKPMKADGTWRGYKNAPVSLKGDSKSITTWSLKKLAGKRYAERLLSVRSSLPRARLCLSMVCVCVCVYPNAPSPHTSYTETPI